MCPAYARHTQQFGKMAGLVLKSTVVLRLNFCAKLNICASISATSPSCKTLCTILERPYTKQSDDRKTIRNINFFADLWTNVCSCNRQWRTILFGRFSCSFLQDRWNRMGSKFSTGLDRLKRNHRI